MGLPLHQRYKIQFLKKTSWYEFQYKYNSLHFDIMIISVVRNETPNSSEMALWIYDMDSSKTLLADHLPHLFCSLAHLSVGPWCKVGGLFWAPKWPVSGELSTGVPEEKVGKKGEWGTLMWCRMRYTASGKWWDALDWVLLDFYDSQV